MQGVLWTKGMLLGAQHLQAQDRFLQDLFEFRLSSMAFRAWGFTRLDVNRESLAGGVLALTDAAGLFSDGLPFDVPAGDPAPAPRPLDEVWGPEQRSMTAHLLIPERRPSGVNVERDQDGSSARFTAEVVLRRDENTGGTEKPIQLARKNLRLAFEGENLQGSSALPLARIVRSDSGEFQLDPSFVPPVLDIAASDYLLSVARRLVELLTARSSSLAGERRQRSKDLADFGVSDVASFWLLYTVNAHLPLFRHAYEVGKGHPERLYRIMLNLAGALTTFSSEVHPSQLPVYDHARLGLCFDELDLLIRKLLGTVIPVHHVSLPLKEVEPSIHATALEEERYLSATEAYVAFKADMDPGEVARRVPQLVKLSSGDRIELLIRQALPGVPLRHVPDPPGALPVKLDYQYFRLERTGREWEAIRLARNVAAYLPSDFPDPDAELLLLLPRESSA